MRVFDALWRNAGLIGYRNPDVAALHPDYARLPDQGRASTPPVSGALTPVVPGNVSGSSRKLRTAR
jgi:hypothetical protein